MLDPCRWDIPLYTSSGCGIPQQSLHLEPQAELSAGILRKFQCAPLKDACGQPFKLASAT